jgi:hypothetical protein
MENREVRVVVVDLEFGDSKERIGKARPRRAKKCNVKSERECEISNPSERTASFYVIISKVSHPSRC